MTIREYRFVLAGRSPELALFGRNHLIRLKASGLATKGTSGGSTASRLARRSQCSSSVGRFAFRVVLYEHFTAIAKILFQRKDAW